VARDFFPIRVTVDNVTHGRRIAMGGCRGADGTDEQSIIR
jgi:hypothetical protein